MPENQAADAHSRHVCGALLYSTKVLKELHDRLCHSVISHFICNRNILCSVEDNISDELKEFLIVVEFSQTAIVCYFKHLKA